MQFDSFMSDDLSVTSSDSFVEKPQVFSDISKARVKTAKFVFLTLKEALVNSLVIIGVGCLGFWFIEQFSFVDSKFDTFCARVGLQSECFLMHIQLVFFFGI